MPSFIEGNNIDKEPLLLFDQSDSSAVNDTVYWGLRNFGPYDKYISNINIATITPRNQLQFIRDLLNDFNNGNSIMPGGMPKFFRCNLELADEITIDSLALDKYEEACLRFINNHDPKDIDVVLAYIPKTSKYFSNTPYYRNKAILTTEGFTSQMITKNTISNLKWSYLNLASAIFSKAGGIPWVLESEMSNVDILIGISISNIISKNIRAGKLPKYLGFINVFDNHGKWMFFEGTAKLYERGKNFDQIRELLLKAIDKFKLEKGVNPKKIIIHYYKRWGKRERDFVIKIFKEILDDFQVGFVSIDDTHPFRLYNKNTSDGSFPRGAYAYLDNNQILLSTTGHTPIAKRRMGTPRLLNIVLHQYPDKFISLDDIAYQIFSLTKLNWATVMPFIREPITLLFSKFIAYLTAAISEQQFESMNDPTVNRILRKKPWFL